MSAKKTYYWIWIAVDRHGKRFVNFVIGDCSTKTGKELWQKIQSLCKGKVATDYYQPYKKIIPKSQHIQSKAETFTVEGYNSLFRHFPAGMRRKSKCYSKNVEMLKLSSLLLINYRNQL